MISCALQVNPPYYVKLVELVPHPETSAAVMDTTHALMTKVKENLDLPCSDNMPLTNKYVTVRDYIVSKVSNPYKSLQAEFKHDEINAMAFWEEMKISLYTCTKD